jgi:acetyl-CoA carboxylase biotin carboxyl carrier protein
VDVSLIWDQNSAFRVDVPGYGQTKLGNVKLSGDAFQAVIDGERVRATVSQARNRLADASDVWLSHGHFVFSFPRKTWADAVHNASALHGNNLVAPMTSRVTKVSVKKGDMVKAEEHIVVLEAMKMEQPIKAPFDAIVTQVFVKEGQVVQDADVLAVLEEIRSL